MALKINPVNFVLAQNAAVVLHAAKSNEMQVRGLQGMGLCLGFTMDTQTVQEMGRRIALVVPSGGSYEETSVNYNFVPGDASLEEFRDAAINSTKLADVRLYVKNGCDFSAPDLISDPASGLYVGSMSDPQVDSPNGLFTGSLNYMPGGAFVLFVAHTPVGAGATLSYTASTRTLAVSGGDEFDTDYGFEVGDTCILDYADGNDPIYLKVESISGASIVFTAGVGGIASLSDFAGIAATALHGATPLVVSGYSGLASCE
jgi:hypothetical protein